jgi:hypothetical protein
MFDVTPQIGISQIAAAGCISSFQRYNVAPLLQRSNMGVGSGMFWWHPMEATTTIQNPPIPASASISLPAPRIPAGASNFLHQILPPMALILGLVATAVWISFLGYQIVRLVEVVL